MYYKANFLDNNKFLSSEEKFLEIIEILNSREAAKMRHDELEDMLGTEGRELLRRLLQEHINNRGMGDVGPSVLGSDGIERNQKKNRKCKMISIFGEVTVKRTGYSAPMGKSLFPKDADLNLTDDSYSFGIRRLVAIETSKNSFEESLQSIKQATGVQVPKRQMETLSLKSAQDFDSFYTTSAEKKIRDVGSIDSSIIVLTMDGKGIIVRKEDLKESTRKKAEESKHKLSKRMSKGEKRNAKRIASVASVYSIEKYVRTPEDVCKEFAPVNLVDKKRKRPKPVDKRVWASIEKDTKRVTDTIFEEAIKRDTKRQKEWVCLVDGDPKQINRIKHSIKKYNVDVTIILDIIHVIEYLWKAARVFYKETDSGVEDWVRLRLLKILQGDASKVAAGITRSATLRKINLKCRKPVDTCANYLVKKAPYLKYSKYLKEGYPIATGVIEGACRHLIKDRMDITGAKWSLKGAEAILKLRALRSSGDFDEYWKFHKEQEYIRNHKSKYGQPLIFIKPQLI